MIPSILHAAIALQQEPLRVEPAVRGGDAVIEVDWGTVGPFIERSATDVDRSLAEFKEQWTSAETLDRLRALKEESDAKEREIGRQQAEDAIARYRSRQTVTIPTATGARVRTLEIPEWLRGIPWDVRKTLEIALVDLSRPGSEAWLLATWRANPRRQLFAVGWTNQEAIDALQVANPGLEVGRIRTVDADHSADRFVTDYLVERLPALVRFPGPDVLELEEGLP